MNRQHRVRWEKEWCFSRDNQVGRSVIQEILDQLERHGWPSTDLFGVHLALEEGVTNAIRHGNGRDPDKQVRVTCRLSSHYIWLEIEDEGPGFNPDAVPDCTCDENLEKLGGRGLYLIQNYMDRVTYEGRGNRLVLEKLRRDE
jgi:serine/threonine-protein kinase RsbW